MFSYYSSPIFFNKVIIYFYLPLLHIAVGEENMDIIKLLLNNENVDVNAPLILDFLFL